MAPPSGQMLSRNLICDPLDSGPYAAGFFSISHHFVAALPGLTWEFGLASVFAGRGQRFDGLPPRAQFLSRMAPPSGQMLSRNLICAPLDSGPYAAGFFSISHHLVAALPGLTWEFGLVSVFAGRCRRFDGLPPRAQFLFRMAPPSGTFANLSGCRSAEGLRRPVE